jgi:transcription-repair coupling factor (superfamily II helicase)
VGLDLYVKLLEQTVLELKGESPREMPRAVLHLGLEMRIPASYVPEVHQRLSLYKRVSQARQEDELSSLRTELRDRYGPQPPEVVGLLRYATLRLQAEALGIAQVDLSSGGLRARIDETTPLVPETLVRLAGERVGAALRPEGLVWPLVPGEDALDCLGALLETLRRSL